MTLADRHHELLRRHLPEAAVEWVYGYVVNHQVHLHITNHRTTKLGDYRWPQPKHPYHEITVNGDLAKAMFLWVFLHEAAHLETRLTAANVRPHGLEWQAQYARLLNEHVDFFPAEARGAIVKYASRLPLNRQLGRTVEAVLKSSGNPNAQPTTQLDQLPAGTLFRLVERSVILFKSIERRRTRWICLDVATGRRYIVSGHAEVNVQPTADSQ